MAQTAIAYGFQVTTRFCTKCKDWKSYNDFHLGEHYGDGMRPDCKECHCKDRLKSYYKNMADPDISRIIKKNRKEYKTEYRKRNEQAKELQTATL